MTVTAAKYVPRPISQRDTLLAANGVDDCRAVSATYLAASATLGEIMIQRTGLQMGRRSRTALVRAARHSLGPAFATGSLNTTATTEMLRFLVPDAPVLRPADMNFGDLRQKLRHGYSASLSGNPSHIKGASPLKRVGDVGHELYLHTERENGDILVGDPFRPYVPRFGEWVPAADLRQFAYQDRDDTLTAVFVVQRGAWTAERLVQDKMAKIIGGRDTTIRTLKRKARDLEDELAACQTGTDTDCDAVRQATLDQAIAALEDLRDDAA